MFCGWNHFIFWSMEWMGGDQVDPSRFKADRRPKQKGGNEWRNLREEITPNTLESKLWRGYLSLACPGDARHDIVWQASRALTTIPSVTSTWFPRVSIGPINTYNACLERPHEHMTSESISKRMQNYVVAVFSCDFPKRGGKIQKKIPV